MRLRFNGKLRECLKPNIYYQFWIIEIIFFYKNNYHIENKLQHTAINVLTLKKCIIKEIWNKKLNRNNWNFERYILYYLDYELVSKTNPC